MDIQLFVSIIALCVMLWAFCTALDKYKNAPSVLKKATWYLFVILVGQAAMFSVLWYRKQNEYSLYHIGFVLEAITLLLMYREIFKKYVKKTEKYVYRKIFVVLIVAFVVFAIVNAIWWQPLGIYPSYARVVLSVMIVTLNILYIYKYTVHEPIPRTGLELVNYQRSKISLFWITTGLLLFHSVSVMRYMFVNVLREELSKEAYTNISNVQAVFAIILYVFIAIGFIKAKRIVIVDEHGNKVDEKKLQ